MNAVSSTPSNISGIAGEDDHTLIHSVQNLCGGVHGTDLSEVPTSGRLESLTAGSVLAVDGTPDELASFVKPSVVCGWNRESVRCELQDTVGDFHDAGSLTPGPTLEIDENSGDVALNMISSCRCISNGVVGHCARGCIVIQGAGLPAAPSSCSFNNARSLAAESIDEDNCFNCSALSSAKASSASSSSLCVIRHDRTESCGAVSLPLSHQDLIKDSVVKCAVQNSFGLGVFDTPGVKMYAGVRDVESKNYTCGTTSGEDDGNLSDVSAGLDTFTTHMKPIPIPSGSKLAFSLDDDLVGNSGCIEASALLLNPGRALSLASPVRATFLNALMASDHYYDSCASGLKSNRPLIGHACKTAQVDRTHGTAHLRVDRTSTDVSSVSVELGRGHGPTFGYRSMSSLASVGFIGEPDDFNAPTNVNGVDELQFTTLGNDRLHVSVSQHGDEDINNAAWNMNMCEGICSSSVDSLHDKSTNSMSDVDNSLVSDIDRAPRLYSGTDSSGVSESKHEVVCECDESRLAAEYKSNATLSDVAYRYQVQRGAWKQWCVFHRRRCLLRRVFSGAERVWMPLDACGYCLPLRLNIPAHRQSHRLAGEHLICCSRNDSICGNGCNEWVHCSLCPWRNNFALLGHVLDCWSRWTVARRQARNRWRLELSANAYYQRSLLVRSVSGWRVVVSKLAFGRRIRAAAPIRLLSSVFSAWARNVVPCFNANSAVYLTSLRSLFNMWARWVRCRRNVPDVHRRKVVARRVLTAWWQQAKASARRRECWRRTYNHFLRRSSIVVLNKIRCGWLAFLVPWWMYKAQRCSLQNSFRAWLSWTQRMRLVHLSRVEHASEHLDLLNAQVYCGNTIGNTLRRTRYLHLASLQAMGRCCANHQRDQPIGAQLFTHLRAFRRSNGDSVSDCLHSRNCIPQMQRVVSPVDSTVRDISHTLGVINVGSLNRKSYLQL